MKKANFALINRLGQVSRTFYWDEPSLVVIQRQDNGRLETVATVKSLEEEGVEFTVIGEVKVDELNRKPFEIGSFGRIRALNDSDSFSPTYEASPEKKGNLKEILRWTAVGQLSLVMLILISSMFLESMQKKEEEAVVKVVPQTIAKKEKTITVDMSERKIKKHNKKVVKAVKKKPKTVAQNNNRRFKSKTNSSKLITKASPGADLKNIGALGVLGAANKKSNRPGGFDASRASSRVAGGSGYAITSGSRRTFVGQGLVAASAGSGDKAQTIGGYGTRGKAGGRNGYGQISLVGSSAGYSTPLDSEAVIEGGLDRDQIAAVIRKNIGQVRFCYEKGLQVEPDLSGRVAVRFIISGAGRVNVAAVSHSSLDSAKVENCIVDRLRSWRFPKPVGNVNVKVTYPFVLNRVSQG